MNFRKLFLRVVVKLMAATVFGFFVYIFVYGLLGKSDDASEKIIALDISQIAEAEVKVIKINNRKALLLHRSHKMIEQLQVFNEGLYDATQSDLKKIKPWFVVYALDPMFGCEIEFVKDKSIFQAICSQQKYDLAGRPYKNQQSQMKLYELAYKLGQQKIFITVP